MSLLSKWEKLEVEVADYIAEVSDIDFKSKTITECKYMQKNASFEIETYQPLRSIGIYLFGGFSSYYATYTYLPSNDILWISNFIPKSVIILIGKLFTFILIFSIPYLFYQAYQEHHSKYIDLILKLEARILSDVDSE